MDIIDKFLHSWVDIGIRLCFGIKRGQGTCNAHDARTRKWHRAANEYAIMR